MTGNGCLQNIVLAQCDCQSMIIFETFPDNLYVSADISQTCRSLTSHVTETFSFTHIRVQQVKLETTQS
jgi:hypothetical protein